MKRYNITHKLLSGDVQSEFETKEEIDAHELEHPEMYEPECVTVVVDNSLILKNINVKHKDKVTLLTLESDFNSEYAQSKHQEKNPDLYEPTCEVIITDKTVVVQKTSAISGRSEVRNKCLKVIDLIAHYNEQADAATMGSIFSTPAFVGITLALLTGAPKTAKAAILLHGSGLYSEDKIAEIVGQLDAIIASEGV